MSAGRENSLSVRQTFVREIERQILSEELKPGDRLPTSRELCTKMGVSLTIVNAGVAELANKGFVEVKPRHESSRALIHPPVQRRTAQCA